MTLTAVAVRIPIELRTDLERVAVQHGSDLSTVLRKALRQHADRELGRSPTGAAGLFAPATGPSHTGDPATSRNAARDNAPRSGTQRARLLGYLLAAGDSGLTYDEANRLDERAGINVAGVGFARRITELRAAGAIGLATTIPGNKLITRVTRNGSEATVYVITDRGRAWLKTAA